MRCRSQIAALCLRLECNAAQFEHAGHILCILVLAANITAAFVAICATTFLVNETVGAFLPRFPSIASTVADSHLPIQFSSSRPSQEGYWQGVAGESVAPIPNLLPK